MERRKKLPEFISDDDLRTVSGGAEPGGEDDFSVYLYCSHCGCKTQMQMISLQCAICEVCRKTNAMPTKL